MGNKGKKDDDTTSHAPYPANWIIDESQRPETLLDHHARNAASPAAHEAYKKAVTDKVAREGVIHIDPATGYRARFQTLAL